MKIYVLATLALALASSASARTHFGKRTASPTANAKSSTVTSVANIPVDEVASHIVPNCDKYYQITATDSCESVAQSNGITQKDLFAWNKGLHNHGAHLCDNLDTGKYFCVGIKQE